VDLILNEEDKINELKIFLTTWINGD